MQQTRAERQTQPDPSAAAGGEMLLAGTVVGVYGVRGWVRIRSFTEPQENLLAYEHWHLARRGAQTPVTVTEGRRHGKGLIAHLEGVDTRDAAEALRGAEIRVPVQELPELPKEDYYWHQLEGLQVWGAQDDKDEKRLFGRVAYLLETGANDVLVVKPCEGSIDERERLIPYLYGDVVRQVDLSAGRIDVAWHPED